MNNPQPLYYYCRLLQSASPPNTSDKEFLGCSNLFDFLLEYPDFCFFDVSWLFNFSDSILGRIVEDTSAKDKIRSTIAVELEKKKLLHSEYERLNEILIKYFC